METTNKSIWDERVQLAIEYSSRGLSFDRNELYDLVEKAKLYGNVKDSSGNIIWYNLDDVSFELENSPTFDAKLRASIYKLAYRLYIKLYS